MSAIIYLTLEECLNLFHLSIYLVLGKSWEVLPGGNLPTTTLILFHLPIHQSWHWENCGRTYLEGTSQRYCHWFYFNYPSIYLALGKSWEDVPGGNHLSSKSFIYLYLFVNMEKCQQFINLCHLSIYLTLGKSWEDVQGGFLLRYCHQSYILLILYLFRGSIYLGVHWWSEFVQRQGCGRPHDTSVCPCLSWWWGCCQTPPLSVDLVSTQVGGNFLLRGGGFAWDRT